MENKKEVVRSLGIDEKLQEFLPYAWLEDRRMTKDAKGGPGKFPGAILLCGPECQEHRPYTQIEISKPG